jgi:hypothetical protein
MKLLQSLFALLLSAGHLPASADEVRVEEIIQRAETAAYYAGDDGRVQARMRIFDAEGREQQRVFSMLRRDIEDRGGQQYLVVFSRPADVRGTVLLVHKHKDRDDDRWLYLPALDLDKRIAAGDKRTSFVGSDFFYEDISGRNPSLDRWTLLSEDDQRIVLRAEPRDPEGVEFAHFEAELDPATYLPRRIDYFDAKGEKLRSIETLKVETVQGHPTVLASEVRDHRRGSRTVLEMRSPQYDLGLDAQAFDTSALRNPPQQWLRP